MIGIFDSGVGGLSIFKEIKKLFPDESIIYVADSKFCPYGNLPPKEIKNRSSKITHFLLSKKVSIVIVACNTATVISLFYLRKKFNLPIVGVVPVVKTAATLTKKKQIAILATKPTLESQYHKNLIRDFCQGIKVTGQDCSGLVFWVEKGKTEGKKIDNLLKKYLKPLIEKEKIDAIALGCTHFPFLAPRIRKIVKNKVFILDSGPAVARQVKRVLSAENLLEKNKNPEYIFYTTGDKDKFEKVAGQLLKKNNIKARKINL